MLFNKLIVLTLLVFVSVFCFLVVLRHFVSNSSTCGKAVMQGQSEKPVAKFGESGFFFSFVEPHWLCVSTEHPRYCGIVML